MELKGSKTEANLRAAFSGESEARNKLYRGKLLKIFIFLVKFVIMRITENWKFSDFLFNRKVILSY